VLPTTVSTATMALLMKKLPNATSNLFHPSEKFSGVNFSGYNPMLFTIS
jgi:hypothetical protein